VALNATLGFTVDVVPDLISSYTHHDGKVAVIVLLHTKDAFTAVMAEVREFASDLAKHIAFSAPLCLDSGDLDLASWNGHLNAHRNALARLDGSEREEAIWKIRGNFEEANFLLQQKFVKDPSKTIGGMLDDLRASTRDPIRIVKWSRYDTRES